MFVHLSSLVHMEARECFRSSIADVTGVCEMSSSVIAASVVNFYSLRRKHFRVASGSMEGILKNRQSPSTELKVD